MKRISTFSIGASLLAALLALEWRASAPAGAEAVAAAEAVRLRAQVKALEELTPDQAAVMTHVAYHFTNLWFAADHDNWPLADFYLGEVRNNVKWAVRAKPVRKGPAGDIQLAGLADAVDGTYFTPLKKAIDAKQKGEFVKAYDQALTGCYACHKASGKPYLRPQRPSAPEVRIINMDPNATAPE